jgi:hypothetical protein
VLEPIGSGAALPAPPDESALSIQINSIDLTLPVEVRAHPRFERPLEVTVRQATLLTSPPWVRSLGKIGMEVTTQGWRFPTPPDQTAISKPRLAQLENEPEAGGPARKNAPAREGERC